MPSKFLRPDSIPKKKSRISWIILAVLIIIVLGGVIVSLVIYFSRETQVPSSPETPANLNVNLEQPALVNDNTNNNNNVNNNQGLDEPSQRDQQRLADITELRSALNIYFSEHDLFPPTLSSLLSQNLAIIPTNPTPGGEDYNYQISDDQLNYQLTFALEESGVLGNLILESGKYILTPLGVSVYNEESSPDINSNSNSNTNTGLPGLPTPPGTQVIAPTKGLDSDSDQLTDIEENLYNTNSTLVDSDGDSYGDLEELLSLYNPTKGSGAKLLDSELVKIYRNPSYNYSLLYPAGWVARSLTSENHEVIFNSNTGEFMEVIVQPNLTALSAYSWYVAQNPNVNTSDLTTLLIDGLPAVQSPDGLTTYLGVGSNIYIITYNIGMSQQMNFYSTYKLFLKTFMFVTPEVPAEENPG